MLLRLVPVLVVGTLLTACGDNGTVAEWEGLRDEALSYEAPDVDGDSWDADLALRVSPKALEDMARMGLEGELERRGQEELRTTGPFGVELTARTELALDSLSLSLTERCAGCVHVEGSVSGEVDWTVAGGVSGTTPLTVSTGADLKLAALQRDGGWVLTAEVTDVEDLDVDLAKLGPIDVSGLFAKELADFVEQGQVWPVAEVGGEDWPITELRFAKNRKGLTLLGRSDVAGPAIRPGKRALDGGWEVRLSTETVLAHLRREAFLAGPADMELAAEPRGLSIDGDQFTLDLRLWKLVRQGWWRDVRVTGRVVLRDGEVRLVPAAAEEVAASPGAEGADPLMFLAKSLLLDGVRKQLEQAIPARHEAEVGEARYAVEIDQVTGQGNALVARGQLVRLPERRGKKRERESRTRTER